MARTLAGIVTSDSRDKTIAVTVTSRETHPIYKKQFTVTRKYAAHDEKNEAAVGDRVIISETRPVSKTKTWRLDSIVERSRGVVELKQDVTEVIEPEETSK
jgi:30S ribosomal protein S17